MSDFIENESETSMEYLALQDSFDCLLLRPDVGPVGTPGNGGGSGTTRPEPVVDAAPTDQVLTIHFPAAAAEAPTRVDSADDETYRVAARTSPIVSPPIMRSGTVL
jgi:hypothetical protein